MKYLTSGFRLLRAGTVLLAALMVLGPFPGRAGGKTPAPRKPLLQLQQEFVDLRFGMFLHFNMATFEDREWGNPADSPAVFNPTNLDTDQWAEAAKSAGMTWGCLTTKHHDGFCLWPTSTKVASIKNTPCRVDIVGAFAESFRKQGLKVGLYYSMLDLRNDIRHFNINKAKIKLVKDQLTELLTNYGEITILIIDGWNAPWSRIDYREIPFHEIYQLVKRLQPNCLVTDLNASEFPASALYYGDIKSFEQNAGQHVPSGSQVPALSCATLTDNWFWKQRHSSAPLCSVNQVVNDWLVPLNKIHCNLILNAPPNREGRLSANLVERLKEIGQAWQHTGPTPPLEPHVVITTKNLATGERILASDCPDTIGPDFTNDGRFHSSWFVPPGQTDGWLELVFPASKRFNTLVLVEPVGQWKEYAESRIKSYRFQRWAGGKWEDIVTGDTPSRVQIHQVPPVSAKRVRLLIEASQDTAHIAEIGLYNEPR